MNPNDPNQPQPVVPSENPTPETAPATATESTPNPFGGTPVSSQEPATPAPVPTSPLSSSPSSNSVPHFLADPKKKKLLILIAAIVGALVVLGIIGLVVIGLLFPSKADYRDAATQFNAVSSAYSDLNSNASKLQYDVSGSTTDTEFTNDSDSVTKSVQTFQDANKKLADMKAVKVGDGKALYDTYNTKVGAYVTYANDVFTSVKSFRPLAKACASVTTSTLLAECVTAVNGVGAVPNADLKQFVTTLQTQYKAYQAVQLKIDAITDPYGDQYSNYKVLRDQKYAIQDKISSAASDLSSNLSKHVGDIDPATAANALGAYLVKHQS